MSWGVLVMVRAILFSRLVPGLMLSASLLGCGSKPADDRAAIESRTSANMAAVANATVPVVVASSEPKSAIANPSPGSKPNPLPLPLPVGFYATDGDCATAMKYGSTGNIGIVIDATHWADIDADYPLHPVEDLGGGKFKLGEAADTLRKTGPNSFIVDEDTEHARTLHWCAEKRPG